MVELMHPLNLVTLEETESTNSDAKDYAAQGGEFFTIFWAKRQTAGRGRFSRKWVSNDGNLFWSILLPISDDISVLSELSLVAGVAVKRTISKYFDIEEKSIQIKWPNDILIDSKKVSGTLIETSVQGGWAVVGIGINVNKRPDLLEGQDEAVAVYPPTCIKDEGGEADVEGICKELSNNFYVLYRSWCDVGFELAMRDEYVDALWNIGKIISVSLNSQKTNVITGVNNGIDHAGCLLVETSYKEVTVVSAADVLFGAVER